MEVVELLKELIKRQSVTPNECGIYEIIKTELADFKAIEIEKNGVKNLFLYKDFAGGNIAESRLDSAESQNLDKNNSAQSANLESRPLRGAKNRIQGCSSATADFLLEAEKRGSPPKSKKRQLLGTHFKKVGGSGAGGAALLRKESSENNGNEIAESARDSSPTAQNDNFKNNTESTLDSANKDKFTKIHLCFAGHIDVVPSGTGWSVPPFDALIKNGVLYGRGAQDMKGGVAAFVSALQKVKKFNGILSVLLTSDEEGDGIFGTKIMLECLKERGLLPHFAIVAEPTCEKKLGDSIKIGRRGSVNGVLKIYGTQGHAAYPHKCVNPLDLIAPILAQISSKDLDSGDKYFAPSKIVITDIHGGIEATNVTPAELRLMFNVRNNPLTDKSAIKSYIESLLKSAGIKKYDLSFSQSAFPFVGAESTLDSADSQNLNQNNSVRSTQTRPLRGAKNQNQASSSASADFLLEAEKRGSPPKSEKAAAFWRVGGAGRGVQPFLRKEKNNNENAESSLDSANLLNILCNAIYKKTHITPRPNTEGGTSDARYFSAFGVEVVEFGLVNDRIHAVDECVNLRDLEALRDIFMDFIADFDNTIKSHNDKVRNSRNSAKQTQQTIEGIAVEVAEFLPNFECETGLGVREHSKFGKSMQDAPKSKLPKPQD